MIRLLIRKIFPLLLLITGLSACLNPEEYSAEELQALVDANLQEKIENYRRVRLERCREELETRANFIVDSILFIQTQQQVDSLFINNKKPKPKRPQVREVPDTRPIAPLFDTILVDSLPGKKQKQDSEF